MNKGSQKKLSIHTTQMGKIYNTHVMNGAKIFNIGLKRLGEKLFMMQMEIEYKVHFIVSMLIVQKTL